MQLTKLDKSIVGEVEKGEYLYPENGAFIWVPFILLFTILAGLYMTNLEHVSPGSTTNTFGACMKTLKVISFGAVGVAIGVLATMLSILGGGWTVVPWIFLPVVIIVPIQLLKRFAPADIAADIKKQFSIFGNKHTWIMSVIYTMTFGSFIGFAFAFGLLIDDLFGTLKNGQVNPDAPSPAIYAPPGPLIGALVRPLGGWLSDCVGSGSKVTAVSTLLQVVTTALVASFVLQAQDAENPNDFFVPFYVSFMFLFVGTGIGNGSTFRSVAYIFSKEQTGPVLGWTSAIAAYGAFVIPRLFGICIEAKRADIACWIFMAYYIVCLVMNWWYYDRKNSGISC